MGWKKFFKKVKRAVTRPVSKVFKGVAKGIAKVGKAVMKGVAKISKKFGPLGMIAMAVAMPYAMGGLSNLIGHGGMAAGQASGWMGSQNVFLRAVGNIGNSIRTGYQVGSGKLGKGFAKVGEKFSQIGSTITDTITKTFQKFSGGGSGENFWTRISKGAKNLFNSAKGVVSGQPKFGTTNVSGWGGPAGGASTGGKYAGISSQMTSQQAVGLLESGAVEGAQLSGQTLGYATRSADKLVTETINKAAEKSISQLSPNSMRHYNDVTNAYKANGTYINNQQALDTVLESQGTSYQGITDFDGLYETDFSMTKDYKIGTTAPGTPTEYTFTGEETFDNSVAKNFKYKDKVKTAKKASYKWIKDSLLKPVEWEPLKEYEFQPTAAAEWADSSGAVLSATDIKGSQGSSSYANVFGDAAWEKLKAYHKHMNYQGSF